MTLTFHLSFSQNTYQTHTSLKYQYSIEFPNTFIKQNIIGANIDFKVANNKGNSIIIIVKKLLSQEVNMTTNDILKIPSESWENNLQLPQVKVIKKGVVSVDSREGMFLHYTSTDYGNSITSYHTNYLFIFKGYLYNLTATCDIKDLSKMQPVFFRALQSFTFPY